MTIAIIVHGGASPVPPEEADAYKHGCLAAVQAGWAVLERGGSACDAVEAAVRVFEDDQTFNAARGGLLNADGDVQMDAAIMEGRDLRFGFLAAGLHLDDAAKHAIDLLGQRVQGEGGCIVIDKHGQVGWAHNSTDMPCAVMTSTMDEPRVWLKKADAGAARAATTF